MKEKENFGLAGNNRLDNILSNMVLEIFDDEGFDAPEVVFNFGENSACRSEYKQKTDTIKLNGHSLAGHFACGGFEYAAIRKDFPQSYSGEKSLVWVVLHESAHALVTKKYGIIYVGDDMKVHGSEFVVELQELQRTYFNLFYVRLKKFFLSCPVFTGQLARLFGEYLATKNRVVVQDCFTNEFSRSRTLPLLAEELLMPYPDKLGLWLYR